MADFMLHTRACCLRELNRNYLSEFLKQVDSQFCEARYSKVYTRYALFNMSVFGDWLQMNKISLKRVDYSHIDEFIASLLHCKTNKLSRKNLTFRKNMAKLIGT